MALNSTAACCTDLRPSRPASWSGSTLLTRPAKARVRAAVTSGPARQPGTTRWKAMRYRAGWSRTSERKTGTPTATRSATGPENYERYFVPAIGRPLANALVDVASVRPGQRVLDVACGTGVAARVAAERIGRDGVVAGADINPGMLAVARSSPAGGVPIEWHEAAADALPFPDGAFDLVLCQLGLQFFPDRLGALRDMRGSWRRRAGRWCSSPGPHPRSSSSWRRPWRVTSPPKSPPSCGSSSPSTTLTSYAASWPTPEEFLWQYVYSTPLATAAADLDDQARAAVTRDVVASWRPFTRQGKLVLELGFSVASGET